MNVFILSTGRCGSMSFAKACEHIENYTAGHETRSHLCGEARLQYPENHIESDNRLSWFLGRLNDEYGDEAAYVHLIRDPNKVAKSYAARAGVKGLIMEAYKNGIYLNTNEPEYLPFAEDYVKTVNKNIEFFLEGKSRRMVFDLDGDTKHQFLEFWNMIGAAGDLEAAFSEFDAVHNAGRKANLIGALKRKLLGA